MRYLPDGIWVILAREDASVAQLMVAPIDLSEPGRLIGPKTSIQSDLSWGISPDGATIFLDVGGDVGGTRVFIDVATGVVETRPDRLALFGSWQRRAP